MGNIFDSLMAEIHKNSFLSAGIIISFLGSLLYSLKNIPLALGNKLINAFVYKIYIDQQDVLYAIFNTWLSDNHSSKFRSVEARIDSIKRLNDAPSNKSDNSNNKQKNALKLINNSPFCLIWFKFKPIIVYKNKDKNDGSTDIFSMYLNSYTIRSVFGKKVILKLLTELTEKYAEEKDGGISVYVHSNYGDFDRLPQMRLKPLSEIILKEDTKIWLIKTINDWVSKKDIYHNLSIPHKLGLILHGPPGNGKTTLAYAIAKEFKKDIYRVNLNNIASNAILENMFIRMPSNSMVLIEDVDCSMSQRVMNNADINFSTLINVMDGIGSLDSCIIIFTTNHIDKLDPALVRNGRMDLKLHVDYPQLEEICKYVNIFYNNPFGGFSIEDKDVKNESLSMVDIQNICLQNTNPLICVNRIKKSLNNKTEA